ncbi:MAG: hypothetical protein BRC40_07775 [Cyanobacteria bacterium QH_8_48_120]|nr:MAG: hypothetical protein BRC40_07775 [Cyanobacteria bacterium QH_8_48_120]
MYYLQKQSAFHHEQIKRTFPNSNFLAIIGYGRAVFGSQKNVGKEPIQSKITAWQQLLSKKEVKAFESVAHKKLLP